MNWLEFSLKRFKKRKYDDNIFKNISSKIDSECKYLTQLCHQECVFDKNNTDNIVKHCRSKSIYEWETVVYLYLLDKKISTLVTGGEHYQITYDTNDKVSLYTHLKNNKNNTKIILNELFGFVSKFRQYNFLHGNLHVHNIFIDPQRYTFYVIDFSNSFLLDDTHQKTPNYQRSSFIGEMDNKITSMLFEYWDIFTLYVSVKLLLKDNLQGINYLETIITNYIKQPDILKRFTDEYLKFNETNILEFHIHIPSFVNR
jgi:hypothetical protein